MNYSKKIRQLSLKIYAFSFDSTIKLEINIDSLESLDEECKKNVSSLETSLDKQNPESLCIKKKNLEIELGALQSRLDESEKAYQNYLDEIAQWEKRREEMIGNADKLDSLKYFEKELEKSISIEPEELRRTKEVRCQKVKDIYFQLKQLAEVYEDLYKPVQKFIDAHELIKNKYKLNFNVTIAETDFIGKFFNYINQGTKGTFYGAQEGKEKLKSILDLCDFNEESNILPFLDEIMSSLETNKEILKKVQLN